jgi:hypothetical protein
MNLRVLLLIRDPRGTMESRTHRDWCPDNPDCQDPSRLCTDMVDDYHSAQELMKTFPDKIKYVPPIPVVVVMIFANFRRKNGVIDVMIKL